MVEMEAADVVLFQATRLPLPYRPTLPDQAAGLVATSEAVMPQAPTNPEVGTRALQTTDRKGRETTKQCPQQCSSVLRHQSCHHLLRLNVKVLSLLQEVTTVPKIK